MSTAHVRRPTNDGISRQEVPTLAHVSLHQLMAMSVAVYDVTRLFPITTFDDRDDPVPERDSLGLIDHILLVKGKLRTSANDQFGVWCRPTPGINLSEIRIAA